uniref:ATP synthase mitochondrial F1 complex assembly factor 2 n=1 Tax=Myotis myotis TaxID=51298 RepID=A0A7J7RD84_MYOMY|nr:ATP synthase mitochondrial F1 complex assembly factor 2 [Myotis myotis]
MSSGAMWRSCLCLRDGWRRLLNRPSGGPTASVGKGANIPFPFRAYAPPADKEVGLARAEEPRPGLQSRKKQKKKPKRLPSWERNPAVLAIFGCFSLCCQESIPWHPGLLDPFPRAVWCSVLECSPLTLPAQGRIPTHTPVMSQSLQSSSHFLLGLAVDMLPSPDIGEHPGCHLDALIQTSRHTQGACRHSHLPSECDWQPVQ